jgi:hypothetical protein
VTCPVFSYLEAVVSSVKLIARERDTYLDSEDDAVLSCSFSVRKHEVWPSLLLWKEESVSSSIRTDKPKPLLQAQLGAISRHIISCESLASLEGKIGRVKVMIEKATIWRYSVNCIHSGQKLFSLR